MSGARSSQECESGRKRTSDQEPLADFDVVAQRGVASQAHCHVLRQLLAIERGTPSLQAYSVGTDFNLQAPNLTTGSAANNLGDRLGQGGLATRRWFIQEGSSGVA
jgi:hypothetical protein